MATLALNAIKVFVIGIAVFWGYSFDGGYSALLFGLLVGTALKIAVVASKQNLSQKSNAVKFVRIGFAICCLVIVLYPQGVSPYHRRIIDRNREQYQTKTALSEIIRSDPRFGNVDFQVFNGKVLVVTIEGKVRNDEDFLAFQSKVATKCKALKPEHTYWNLTLETNGVIEGNSAKIQLQRETLDREK